MNFLRKYWQDLGIAVALIVGLSLYVEWQNITEIRAILWLSFVAILSTNLKNIAGQDISEDCSMC